MININHISQYQLLVNHHNDSQSFEMNCQFNIPNYFDNKNEHNITFKNCMQKQQIY
jgi:hypothetical protein